MEPTQSERYEAFTQACELLRGGEEFELDRAIMLADWLLTGEATLAFRFSEQTARAYSMQRHAVQEPNGQQLYSERVQGQPSLLPSTGPGLDSSRYQLP